MRFIKLFVVCIAIVLAGCAASGVKQKDMASSIPTIGADEGRIFFYRSSGFAGGAVRPSIKLDGAIVGESQPGGFFYVDAAPGKHEVATSTEAENKLTFVLEKGEVKYVKTSVSMGLFVGRVIPTLASKTEAMAELPDLSYTGGPTPKK
jgi:Protein of unknown function (DUF2846)